MELNASAELVEEEKHMLASELEWLEGLISEAEKGHRSDVGDLAGLQRMLARDAVKTETHAVVAQLNDTRAELERALAIADTVRVD